MNTRGLQKQLFKYGLYAKDVIGDGNCLFRAVSDFLEGSEELMHEEYRDLAVIYMDENRELFANFITKADARNFDEYLGQMQEPGTFAGHPELVALSAILNVRFIVHEYNKPSVEIKDNELKENYSGSVHLAYYQSKLHYNSVRRLNDKSNQPAEIIPWNFMKKQNLSERINQDNLCDKNNTLVKTKTKKSNKDKSKSQSDKQSNKSQDVNPCWELLKSDDICILDNKYKIFNDRVLKKTNYRQYTKNLKSPVDFASLFLTNEFFDEIVKYTNQRATSLGLDCLNLDSHNKSWTNCDRQEMKAFFAILLHMGITRAPDYKFYWTKDSRFRVTGIAEVLSRDRFLMIKRCIYYNSDKDQNMDRIYKIRPVFDLLANYCEKYWIPEQKLSLDESMINFQGRHFGTVYMPSKPIRNGFKIYVLASTKGYVRRFLPSFCLDAKKTTEELVLKLIEGLEGKGYHLFMDRNLELISFGATGAIGCNRIPSGLMITSDSMSNEFIFWRSQEKNVNLLLCCLNSEKKYYFISNVIGIEMLVKGQLDSVESNDSLDNLDEDQGTLEIVDSDDENDSEKRSEDVDGETNDENTHENGAEVMDVETNSDVYVPKLTTEYVSNMRGVDHFNQRTSYYRFPHRHIRWYRTIIGWLTEVAVNNAYILHEKIHPNSKLTPLKFRMAIIKEWEESFISSKNIKESYKGQNQVDSKLQQCKLGHTNDYAFGNCTYCPNPLKGMRRKRTCWICLRCRIFVCPHCSIHHFTAVYNV